MTFTVDKLKQIGAKITDEEIISVLDKIEIKKGQYVMDLGAGAGRYTLAFSEAVSERGMVYCVDTRSEILDYIKSQATSKGYNNIEYVVADQPKYNFKEGSLDIIFTRNVLHHLPNTIEYLKELRKYLKEDGKLIFIDHNKNAKIPGHDPSDLYSLEEAKSVAIRAGYSVYKHFNVHKHKLFLILNK